LIILGRPIIQVLLERGEFDAYSTLMTNRALFFYVLGLWAFSGIRVIVSAFYALQDTKTPVKVAFVAFLVNLFFSLVLMGPLKHAGIALALSLSSTIQFFLLIFFLQRKIQMDDLRPILISALKCSFAATVMGLGVFYIHSKWLLLDPGVGLLRMITNLAGLIIIGIIIYFMVTRIIGCRELASIGEMFRPLLRRIGIRHD